MKKLLLGISSFLLLSGAAIGQCTPDYDFGEAGFGVSPDPNEGETFATGTVGLPYEDVIHMLVPTEAGDVDSAYQDVSANIDSLTLVAVMISIDGELQPIQTIGLDYMCNNLGDSPDPCTFMGGEQYCADIFGTPTQDGEFPLQIDVVGYLQIFGQTIPVPTSFEDYSLTINPEGTVSITEQKSFTMEVGQNSPNPFSGTTTLNFTVSQPSEATFNVMNLLGEKVHIQKMMASPGNNKIVFDASMLRSGIYLYGIEAGGHTVTKRMVIND